MASPDFNIEMYVRYDFADLFPTDIDSWRGSYSELALDYQNKVGMEMTVTDFLDMLTMCIGKTFVGYKGGEYVMGIGTPIWVANSGKSGSTAVVGVVNNGHSVILVTGCVEF